MRQLVDRVGMREAAPGGGSVTAVTAALAAGLVTMAARYSVGRLDEAAGLVNNGEEWSRRALELSDRDSVVYADVLAAQSALRSTEGGDPEPKAAAVSRLQVALTVAAEVPVQMAELAAHVATAAALLVDRGSPSVSGDAECARRLAVAAAQSAAHLVAIDVEALSPDPSRPVGSASVSTINGKNRIRNSSDGEIAREDYATADPAARLSHRAEAAVAAAMSTDGDA